MEIREDFGVAQRSSRPAQQFFNNLLEHATHALLTMLHFPLQQLVLTPVVVLQLVAVRLVA